VAGEPGGGYWPGSWTRLDWDHWYFCDPASGPVGVVWDCRGEPPPLRYRWECAGRAGRCRSLVEARVSVEWAWEECGDAWSRE
jgi:hypothetical protein